jgi:hypothetical protein
MLPLVLAGTVVAGLYLNHWCVHTWHTLTVRQLGRLRREVRTMLLDRGLLRFVLAYSSPSHTGEGSLRDGLEAVSARYPLLCVAAGLPVSRTYHWLAQHHAQRLGWPALLGALLCGTGALRLHWELAGPGSRPHSRYAASAAWWSTACSKHMPGSVCWSAWQYAMNCRQRCLVIRWLNRPLISKQHLQQPWQLSLPQRYGTYQQNFNKIATLLNFGWD